MYDTPYEDVAKDAMDGKRVAVFCDTDTDIKLCKNGIAAAAKRLGARKVVYPLRDKRLSIDGNTVRFCIPNGLDGRGMSADVVYLSESARYQFEYAKVVSASIK